MLTATLVELRIRGLREFQGKRKRQILEIHCESLVIDQTALQYGDILGRIELDGIGQQSRELIVDDGIWTQRNRELGRRRDQVVILRSRLHGDLVIDLEKLVIGTSHVRDRRRDHYRG